MRNYYDILGVKDDATTDEIKTAYRRLSSKFHPDKNGGDKFFEEQFKKIQEAYQALSNTASRKKYDAEYFSFFSSASNNRSNKKKSSTQSELKITLFDCDKKSVFDGEELQVIWAVENATTVKINCLKGEQPSQGKKTVKITKKNREQVKINIIAESDCGKVGDYILVNIVPKKNERKESVSSVDDSEELAILDKPFIFIANLILILTLISFVIAYILPKSL